MRSKTTFSKQKDQRLAQNIGATYKEADDQLKRYYLNLFFGGGGFFVKDGKIVKAKLSNDVKPLIKDGSVRVIMNWLERWYVFRRTDWVNYLEYPEFTTKEVTRFLQI